MYEYITGEIKEITPTYTVIEASGIGYMINTSLQSFTAIGSAASAKLYIHHVQREDAQLLFGFVSRAERELFRLLITVSGIGTNTARIMLSSYSVDDLVQIIATGNVAALQGIKGIGAKTAERTIVDLKSKVMNVSTLIDTSLPGGVASSFGGGSSEQAQEAISALMILGFTRASCEKIVKSISRNDPTLQAEALIRQALSQL